MGALGSLCYELERWFLNTEEKNGATATFMRKCHFQLSQLLYVVKTTVYVDISVIAIV